MTQDWKEKLQSEIMEEYIFLAEMKQHAKDKTAHMIRMREQWDKLCNFIEGERNAVLSEVEREVEKNLYCGTCGSPTEYCKRCNEGDKAIDYVDISTIINNLRVK